MRKRRRRTDLKFFMQKRNETHGRERLEGGEWRAELGNQNICASGIKRAAEKVKRKKGATV